MNMNVSTSRVEKSPPFVLRRARREDLSAIMALEEAAFAVGERDELATYEHEIDHAASFLLAWSDDDGCDELVGHFIAQAWPAEWREVAQHYQLGDAIARGDAGTLFVESICLHPRHHGKGWSRELLERGLAATVERRDGGAMQEIVAAIRADNHASIALFRRSGFVEVFERDRYFPSRTDLRMIFFRCDISS
jgi:ribosomal protein S18 acetylase RimI-like enzyme